MNREQQKQAIQDAATKMAKVCGVAGLTREEVCTEAGVADGSFKHVMGCTFTEFIARMPDVNASGTDLTAGRNRVDPVTRKEQILNAAIEVAKACGFNNVKRKGIAEKAGISEALVQHHFGTMPQLKRAIMREARLKSVPEIIAQGLAIGDPQALKAPKELKDLAAKHLANK